MNILITGGAGFIGSNLVKHHVDLTDSVYVIDNLITGSETNLNNVPKEKFNFFKSDVTNFNYSSLPRFDIVYHLASPASPIQYKKHPIETLMANSLGTKMLLDFMKRSSSGIFVLASTSETYGDPTVHPQNETYWGNVNPVGTRACYDEAKRFAEAITMSYFRKYQINMRIARIFNTYGPNMEQNDGRVVSNFIMQSLTQKPMTIYGSGKQTRSFCFVSDMVQGLYKLATIPTIEGEIINLGNPDERTIKELADLVKSLTGSKSQIVFEPIDEDDPKKRKPDIGKAKRLLQWEPTLSLEEGLKKTISYFKERFL